MNTLRVLSGSGTAIKKPSVGPLLRLKRMNASFYAALKLHLLTDKQRFTFNTCVERLTLPDHVDDAAVIQALANPEKDFLEDFLAVDDPTRVWWHGMLAMIGVGKEEQAARDAIRRRLGFLRRVIEHTKTTS